MTTMNHADHVREAIQVHRDELAAQIAELESQIASLREQDDELAAMAAPRNGRPTPSAPDAVRRRTQPVAPKAAKGRPRKGVDARTQVLALLRERGELSQATLRQEAGVSSSSTMTHLMSAMEDEGLIEREQVSTRGDKVVRLSHDAAARIAAELEAVAV